MIQAREEDPIIATLHGDQGTKEASPDWSFDAQGWLLTAPTGVFWQKIVSPNCDVRPPDAEISLLVIHNISLPPGQFGGAAIGDLFTNQLDCDAHPFFAGLSGLRVSSHFLLRRDGSVIQFVACRQRAWHAGVSRWKNRECCNDFSIGIELEGTDTLTYTELQYGALIGLSQRLAAIYPITAAVGHSDIAPGRKTDPGPAFDWPRLYSGIAKNLVQSD